MGEMERSDSMNSDAYFRLLFEQAGMAMVAADLDGKIVACNDSACRMFDVPEMVGTDWTELVPVDERERAEGLLAECIEAGKADEFEFSVRDERGRSRRLAVVVTPIIAADGRRGGGLACVRDITNRMVLQQRLAQQSKMAALGEMAGALSHHFNNILGGVVMSVDFAMASGDPNVMARVMEKTATALSRATGLVENLLAFAQGDFRDATVAELGEVLLDLIAQTEPKLRDTSINLEVDLKEIPVVEVPRSATLTVLNNLVDNGIEAMPRGGTLSLSVERREEDVIISIGDTGCGLDEESLTRIFEPFFSTKGREGEGTMNHGLGLAVAHGILKVLRGSVHVTSTVGEGTIFEVRLPLKGPNNS